MRTKTFASGLIALAVLAAIALAGCGKSKEVSLKQVGITEADNGRQVSLPVGADLVISLESNPSTGYGWQVTSAPAAGLKQTGGPTFEADKSKQGMPGAGGRETFTFKAVAPGQAKIEMVYERPWETVPPLMTFGLTVDMR